MWFLAVRIARSAGRVRWLLGGNVLVGDEGRDEEGGEIGGDSLSISRWVRGWDRVLKNDTIEVKAET